MKYILIILLFWTNIVHAQTYYVDATNGNDANSGLTTGTAWKTLAKVNSFSFPGGNSVLLKRGETFYGDIKVHDNNMTYGAYGTGAEPIITGLQTISSYSSNSNGIYEANITADSTLNLVLFNGVLAQKATGANPDSANGGWKKFIGIRTYNNSGWRRDSIRGIPSGMVGKKILLKQNDWSIMLVIITKQTGDTTIYKKWHSLNIGGSSPLDQSKDGWGWKPYDEIEYINRDGEFTYKGGKIYIKRNTETISYSGVDTLFDNAGFDGTTITDIHFRGGNQFGVYGSTCDDITITGCTFDYMGAEGIAFYRLSNSNISNNNFDNIHATAVYIQSVSSPYNNITVNSNVITNVGLMEGMGSWGMFGDYSGMMITAFDGLTCRYNYIESIGDCGIKSNGSNVDIAYNWIRDFCKILQDHGGIYCYWELALCPGVTVPGNCVYFRGMAIHNNFISKANGNKNGTGTSYLVANLIYMDGAYGFADIYENYGWDFNRTGINLNMDSNISVRNNILIPGPLNAVARCIAVRQFGVPVKNALVSNNICIVDNINQMFLAYSANPVIGSGTYDSNYIQQYILPFIIKENAPSATYTQAQWLTLTGYGSHDRLLSYRNEAQRFLAKNWSASEVTVSLDGKYIDVSGTEYNGVINVPAYKAVYLMRTGDVIINPPPSGTFITAPFIIKQ